MDFRQWQSMKEGEYLEVFKMSNSPFPLKRMDSKTLIECLKNEPKVPMEELERSSREFEKLYLSSHPKWRCLGMRIKYLLKK